MTPLVCPRCRGPLTPVDAASAFHCVTCDENYPVDNGIADFSGGKYYDQFHGPEDLDEVAKEGLDAECAGAVSRIADFYEPLLRRAGVLRVLDCGVGNGMSVDLLGDAGYDAWALDLSALRKWQWHQRKRRDRLVVADALRMPFADGSFDAVISSGVIEHIGVAEERNPGYAVRPLPERDTLRTAFLAELLRVCSPAGTIYIDCPNGSFPIDFWHGTSVGEARLHGWSEGFLPTLADVRRLARGVDPHLNVDPISPFRRLQFRQARTRRYRRLLVPVMDGIFRAMTLPPFRWLAATPLNPYLVVRLQREGRRAAAPLHPIKAK
jgi:SAM-dependent methyltransferase